MPRLTFVQADGKRTDVTANAGETVMRVALNNNIPGLVAECGGTLSCATCHGYVAEEWVNRVPPPSDEEQVMVDCAIDVRPNSRLTCQLTMTDDLDGLTIEIPASQY